MTKAQLIEEVKKAKATGVEFVTYGVQDLGIAVKIDDAIADFLSMDDETIGEGTWYPCDAEGNVI